MLSRNNRIVTGCDRIAGSAIALHQATMALYRTAIALQEPQWHVELRRSKFDALR